MDKQAATVVLSGGQDSTTCLGWALHKYNSVRTVTFDYGQRHHIEIAAASYVIDYFERKLNIEIPREIVRIDKGSFAGMSPLTDARAQLETYSNHDEMERIIGDRIEKTFVPMRNAVFLMLAANRAFVNGHRTLVTGVCQADNANYPDCRESFVRAAELTIREALDCPEFEIEAPLLHLTKAESIKLALRLSHTYEALAYSHTAYDGKYPPTSKDHASVLRAYGFEQAGVPDPLVVRAWREGRMELPTTTNYKDLL